MTRDDAHPHAPAATPDHVAKLLAEASQVTSIDQGGQVEIQLGHFCNNRCVFCGSGQLTEQGFAVPVPDAAVMRAIDAAAARGVHRVTFLGGEPTIQESFLPSLAHARSLGVDDITIFTNGARTWDVRFLEAVLAGGAVRWRISIQGGDAASHDAIVGKRGAFKRIVRGLALLHERGQDVTVNMCLTTDALAALPALAEVVVTHGVRQLCVDMVRAVSAGDRSDAWLQRIIPRFSDVAPALRGLLAEIDRLHPGFDINLTHVPYCVLPDEAHRLHHGGEPTVTFTADLAERQGAMDKYAFQASDRGHMPRCAECVFSPRCTGVSHVYRRWHGDAEFAPVTAADLAHVDPLQHAFVDGLRDDLQRLAGVEVVADPRQRRAELRIEGGTAWLLPSAEPLPGGLWSVARSTRWRLGITPGACSAAAASVAQRYARQLDPQANIGALDLARGARLRAWLRRVAARVQGVAAASPIQVISVGWVYGALHVRVVHGGDTVDLSIAPLADGARPFAFSAGDDDPEKPGRKIVSAWIGSLVRGCRLGSATASVD